MTTANSGAEDGALSTVNQDTGARPELGANFLSEFFLDGGAPAAPAPERDAVPIAAPDP